METLIVEEFPTYLRAKIHRPEAKNSINSTLLKEMMQLVDQLESNDDLRILFLEGEGGIFCSGMDFQQVIDDEAPESSDEYMNILKRINQSHKIVVSVIDGKVLAGGVGIVAASHLVIATEKTTFCLPEANWGLLPCMVMPYLIRRVGHQKAYEMTLTTQVINGERAYQIGLVDQFTDSIERNMQILAQRLSRISPITLKDLKGLFSTLAPWDEEKEKFVVNEISRLMAKPEVRENITNFVKNQTLPWQRSS